MFTALALVSAATAAAVGFAHTPVGRRIVDRIVNNEGRVGLHRQGTPRAKAEAWNASNRMLGILEAAWIELAPATRQVTMIQNAPSWS